MVHGRPPDAAAAQPCQPAQPEGRAEQRDERFVRPQQGDNRAAADADDERGDEDEQVRGGSWPGHDPPDEARRDHREHRVPDLDACQCPGRHDGEQQDGVEPPAPQGRPYGTRGTGRRPGQPSGEPPWPLPAGGSRQPRHAFRQLTPAVPERLCQPIHLRSPQGRLRGQVDDSAPRADQEHRGNAAGRARQAAGQEVRPGPRRHRHDGRADEGLPEQPQRPLSATRQFSPQDAHEIPRRHRAAGGKGEAEGREQRGAADVRGGGDYTARVHGRLDDHPAQRVDGVPARIAGVGRDQEQRLADDGRRQA